MHCSHDDDNDDAGEDDDENDNDDQETRIFIRCILITHKIATDLKIPKTSVKKQAQSNKIQNPTENGTLSIPSKFSGDFEELEERVKSMMEKSKNSLPYRNQKADICKVCGKEGMSNAIKDHIEANHLEGIVIPCHLCDKTFRSRNGFRQHKRQHQNILI